MKASLILCFTVLAVCACAFGGYPAEAGIHDGVPAHIETDNEIEGTIIKGILANPEVLAANLKVTVSNGIVTLRGWVRDAAAKTMAGDVARATPGVRKVNNLLELRSAKARSACFYFPDRRTVT